MPMCHKNGTPHFILEEEEFSNLFEKGLRPSTSALLSPFSILDRLNFSPAVSCGGYPTSHTRSARLEKKKEVEDGEEEKTDKKW